jgi:hypothetical protein
MECLRKHEHHGVMSTWSCFDKIWFVHEMSLKQDHDVSAKNGKYLLDIFGKCHVITDFRNQNLIPRRNF